MKSIILLAMSTLGKKENLDEPGNNFSVTNEEGTIIEDCRSQLEPVVRYFLRDSQCSKQVEVLMLCTRQTLEIDTYHNEIKLKDAEGKEVDQVSAVTFLMDRINKCTERGEKEITYKAFPLYREGTDKHLPQIQCEKVLSKTEKNALEYVEAYPPDYLSGIREVIKRVREIVEENKQKTSFYIVTHGGFRDVVLSLNAIISLLDGEGIEPTKICGAKTSPPTIEDQRASFDIFRFVSGMRDFLNFGNVDTLQKYYEEFAYLYSSEEANIEYVEDFNQKLLGAMNQVSGGVQYSDPQKYISGLDLLKEVLDSDREDTFEKTNLGIFKDTIKKDFGILLDSEKRTEIDLVERCLVKKQYQQALTFLDSSLPEYYRKKSIVVFSDNGTVEYANIFKILLGQLKFLGGSVEQAAYDYIIAFCSKLKTEKQSDKETQCWELIKDKSCWHERLEECVKSNNLIELVEKRKRKNTKRIEIDFTNGNYSPDSFVEKVLPVLMMHKALREVRHQLNHGDEKLRPSFEDLELCMRYYLKALKFLGEERSERNDLLEDK